jgi:hypothetical protein
MFSDLFKKSSLPSLFENQVLSGSHSNHDLNFGLKHAIPKSTHPFVTVKDLDDPLIKKPIVHSAWKNIAHNQVWKENFGNFKNKISMSESFSIDSMIKSDRYKDLLEAAKTSPNTDLHSFVIDNIPKKEKKFIHTPWYDFTIDQNAPNKVKGRILNRVSGGYSVGISGIVAYLPNEYYSYQALIDQIKKDESPIVEKAHLGKVSRAVDRDSVYEFYVVLARYDHLLRPEVILSTTTPKEEIQEIGATTKKRRSDNMINLLKILNRKI